MTISTRPASDAGAPRGTSATNPLNILVGKSAGQAASRVLNFQAGHAGAHGILCPVQLCTDVRVSLAGGAWLPVGKRETTLGDGR